MRFQTLGPARARPRRGAADRTAAVPARPSRPLPLRPGGSVRLHVVVDARGHRRVEGREVLGVGLALDVDVARPPRRRPSTATGATAAGAGPRRAGGVAGPPGTTVGGLAGLMRAEPSSPTGSVKCDVRRVERRDLGVGPAADARRARPRGTRSRPGGAGRRPRGRRSPGGRAGPAARPRAAAWPWGRSVGAVIRDPPRSRARRKPRAGVRCMFVIPHSWPQGSRPDTCSELSGRRPARPIRRAAHFGGTGQGQWGELTQRACIGRYRPGPRADGPTRGRLAVRRQGAAA